MAARATAPAGVEIPALSPTAVHGPIGPSKPYAIVFPVVHTPYDYDERI